MKNYFNFRKFGNEYLITNDAGRFAFLNTSEFKDLLQDHISLHDDIGKRLVSDGFITVKHPLILSDQMKDNIRDSHGYLFNATSLHIFVVTTLCNFQCIYCQAQTGKKPANGIMDFSVAEKAVDIALSSPNDYLTFEFQGGEPLANFDTIRHIVEYTESRRGTKKIEFSIVSNLTMLTDEMAEYIASHNILVSTSIDGPSEIHNLNRPYKNGGETFANTIKGIRLCREKGIHLGAIQTTTLYSLNHAKEIIDCYLENGFDNLFVRPLTPLGCASSSWERIGYTPEAFIQFYKKCLEYIIELNLNGTFIAENHAKIFLSKILAGHSVNYMELRSPCGSGIGQLAYYWDGNIYTCDEGRMLAEMGNKAFRLGNVNDSTYQEIIDSPSCHAVCKASILESLPSCCECIYQPYCGVCPVVNLALEEDIIAKQTNNYRCKIYKGMLDVLFQYMHMNDPQIMKVFGDWLC